MASAQVALGIAPTLMSLLSPSVGEISMLSANRPVLSVMLSLGCPTIFSVRSLQYDDPFGILQGSNSSLFRQRRILLPTKRHAFLSAVEYLAALLAIANVLSLDGQLGYMTVSTLNTHYPYLVYLWSLLALVPHGISASAFYFSRSMRAERKANQQQRKEENTAGIWRARFKREATICAAKRRRGYLEHREEEPFWVIALNLLSVMLGLGLLIFGTLLFSSLLFVGIIDAVGVIFQYFISTVVCRVIMVFELRGIMAVKSDQVILHEPPKHKSASEPSR